MFEEMDKLVTGFGSAIDNAVKPAQKMNEAVGDDWTKQEEHDVFDLHCGSCVLIMLKSQHDGITIDSDGMTVDISWVRSKGQAQATTGRYCADEILAWKSI